MPRFLTSLDLVANIAQIGATPLWLILVLMIWALPETTRAAQMIKRGQPAKLSWWFALRQTYKKAPKRKRRMMVTVGLLAALLSGFDIANDYGFKDWLIYHNLTEVEQCSYFNEVVTLDGYFYHNCKFDHVTFLYNGGPLRFLNNSVSYSRMVTTDQKILRAQFFISQMQDAPAPTPPPGK
jgi:hypothetical protein